VFFLWTHTITIDRAPSAALQQGGGDTGGGFTCGWGFRLHLFRRGDLSLINWTCSGVVRMHRHGMVIQATLSDCSVSKLLFSWTTARHYTPQCCEDEPLAGDPIWWWYIHSTAEATNL
jgi:hypothetical protein